MSRAHGSFLSTAAARLAAVGLACALAGVAHALAADAPPAPERAIGIEGDVTVVLPRGDYQPRPLDDRTPLIVRIEKVTPAANGFQYDLHFIGFESGSYRLTRYLMRPDGSAADEIGEVEIEVRAILPPDHDGSLTPYLPQPFPWFGGYRILLGALAALWLLGVLAFIFIGRRKPPHVAPVVEAPPPSYAERLRPLVEAAAIGRLGADGQAELERLMTGYWRDKLAMVSPRMADAVLELKRHPEAGVLLRAIESWLHRPGGVGGAEITKLLEPYGRPPAPAVMQEAAS